MDLLVIDQEPLATEEGKPPAQWPSSGKIKVDHLSAQYSNSKIFVAVTRKAKWTNIFRWPTCAS